MKHILNWLISLIIFIIISPLLIVYIPIIIVVLFAEPYYDNRANKGEVLFTVFKGPISLFKKIYNKVHLK